MEIQDFDQRMSSMPCGRFGQIIACQAEESVARRLDQRLDVPISQLARVVASIEGWLCRTRNNEKCITRIASRCALRLVQRRGGDREQLDLLAMYFLDMTGLVDYLYIMSLAKDTAEVDWFKARGGQQR